MGLHDPAAPPEWGAFVKRYRHHDLSATNAVRLLFRVLGEDRRMLLLVDELRIADNDKEVMKELGRVLNIYGNVDVLVSALSPKYIADLVWSINQRPITDILLPPLLDADLCRKECSAWADRLIAATKNPKQVSDMERNLLRNFHLLFSGHPRSFEFFQRQLLMEGKSWGSVIKALDSGLGVSNLAFELANIALAIAPESMGLRSSQDVVESFVLSSQSFEVKDNFFRDTLEKGKIFIIREKDRSFIPAVPVWALLDLIHQKEMASWATPRCTAAHALIGNFIKDRNPVTWWERLVDLTIACRSHDYNNLEEMFGFSNFDYVMWNRAVPLRVLNEGDIIEAAQAQKVTAHTVKNAMAALENVLVTAAPKKAGFDSMVKLCLPEAAPLYFYNQMKLSYPQGKSLEEVIGKIICYVLQYHLTDVGDDLSAVYITLYNWGDDTTDMDEEPPLDDHVLRSELDTVLENVRKNFKLPENFSQRLTEFVDRYLDHIHFVGQKRMQQWLLPTLLPFPRILMNITEA
jgi:hypothetical protein